MRWIVLLLIALPSLAAPYDAKLRNFETFVRRRMQDDRSVGLTIGFVKGSVKGDVTWVKSFGVADLENGTSARNDSSYRMASVTKTMTAVAILNFADEGKLDLDAEVQRYVPAYPRKQHPVRIRQLLGHIAGTPSYETMAEQAMKVAETSAETIARIGGAELIAEPETRFSYSNHGFMLLRAVIESVSGKSYDDYLREAIWAPLGMRNTRADDPVSVIPNRVRGYRLIDGKVQNSEFTDPRSRLGAGGVRSTVPDLLAFARGLFAGRILAPATRDRMWTSMTVQGGRPTPYGMGWWTGSRNGRFAVYHGGGTQETRTYLLLLPSEQFAVAVAANFEGADPAPYLYALYETILDERWDVGTYAENEADRTRLAAMDRAFDEGMRHFDRYRKAMTTDLAAAFAAEQPSAALVSYMAAQLRETMSAERFNTYYRDGAIPFFADYVAWSRKTSKFRFSEATERELLRLNADWTKTWNAYTRDLDLDRTSDLNQVGTRLRDIFKGAAVRPSFENDFLFLARAHMAHGEIAQGLEGARLAVELYPKSAQTHGILAVLHTVAGDLEKARASFQTSKELNPHSAAS
ncbi:MAG TPA: serine hydrolase, partial [Thermoanaerobaculia bacterium]|nr:serine hydrolase [Thermoanaerobaculia bacterium]